MKGTFTLAIYIAIGITGAAFGQTKPPASALQYAARPEPIATTAAALAPSVGIIGHANPVTTVAITPAPSSATPMPPKVDRGAPPLERVVMRWGAGGNVNDHRQTFGAYGLKGTFVELRGPCYSACTLITGYVDKAKLCIAEGAFMAFHAVRTLNSKVYLSDETRKAYYTWPHEIRLWIDRNGGWEKLPIDGFWTMYDRDLWAMGYPKCK